MKCNIKGCGKIDGGFEDGICRPCYSFITADQGKEHMSERTKAQFEQHEKQFKKNQILKQFKKNQILMSVDVIREVINIIEQSMDCPLAYRLFVISEIKKALLEGLLADEEEKEAHEMKHGLSCVWVEGKAQDK